MNKEQHIIQSWQANAGNWINLIESNGIESRKLVTNQAILDAVLAMQPLTVLDIGCGEGWLLKEFASRNIDVAGIDVIPELINKTKEKVHGEFFVASYEDVAAGKISFSKRFEAIVINFALIGKESTENLLAALPPFMTQPGKLFIQTLHPYVRKEINDYASGWKEGSWDGLGQQFTQAYQWYFRTLEDWLSLLGHSGFIDIQTIETRHPVSGKLLSVIFQCNVK